MEEKEIFTEERKEQVQLALEENGIQVTVDELLQFIKVSIEGREKLKFVFTKSVTPSIFSTVTTAPSGIVSPSKDFEISFNSMSFFCSITRIYSLVQKNSKIPQK